MTTETSALAYIKGGEFLIRNSDPKEMFFPEDFTEDHKMMRSAMRDFLNKELEPIKEKFDTAEGVKIAPVLLEKMGALGYLTLTIPEKYGGLSVDFKTEFAAAELAADSFAFSQAMGIQCGLGIYPIWLYGTEFQKEKYLHGLSKGTIKSSYCLTEPGAGSDAMSGKTKAVFTEDRRHLILNGQKMWISNAGFADLFFVFCKIEDDKKLSCLIVEKGWGVEVGAEEKKLGINGASTCQVFFENVKVPVENILGERDKAFKIAMNALNLGRIKVGIAGTMISKRALRLAVEYGSQRIQFGQQIIEFGALQHKLAEMIIRIYAAESSWTRLSHEIDTAHSYFKESAATPQKAKNKAVAEYAMECSIIKVFGSESEQFVVDESLQMHGGMGFSKESEIETLYRNIRGNRIYEGTNEINKLLIPTMLLRKAMKGELPLMEKGMELMQELMAGNLGDPAKNEGEFKIEKDYLDKAKKAGLLVTGLASQTFQMKIKDEQEVLTRIAEVLTEIYTFESALSRCLKHPSPMKASIVKVLMHRSAAIIRQSGTEIIYAASEGEQSELILKSLLKLCRLPACNLKEERRKIARFSIESKNYKIS